MSITGFRVQVQTKDGIWKDLFHADFPMAVREVTSLKGRGHKARFVSDEPKKTSRKSKSRIYTAVR